MADNRGHVNPRHVSYAETLDDFPTPPWATRAFFRYVVPELTGRHDLCFLEPAVGRGHMVRAIAEVTRSAPYATDARDYGVGYDVADYIDPTVTYPDYDVMMTNPPFKLAERFLERGLREARMGVALLARTLFLEGGGRFERLYDVRPPSRIAIFSGRMPAAQGRLVRGGAIFSHCWFWWNLTREQPMYPSFIWIPPGAQRELEREEDYRG